MNCLKNYLIPSFFSFNLFFLGKFNLIFEVIQVPPALGNHLGSSQAEPGTFPTMLVAALWCHCPPKRVFGT